MSQNENKNNLNEQEALEAIFGQVRRAHIEPSPYLKTRVLAHLKAGQKHQKNLRFWQFFSAGSFAAMLLVAIYAVDITKTLKTDGAANQAYVIHVEFNQDDLSKVAQAEVVLPDDVYFKSSKGKLRDQRQLKLPVELKTAGRGKLPFVVTSEAEGEKSILVRLLDENNNVVREQTLKFKFAKSGEKISL